MILIIDRSKKDAVKMAEMLYYMGVLAYGTEPKEALSEISNIYHAVVIINPNNLPDTVNYIHKIRSYVSIPIFALSKDRVNSDFVFDGIFSNTYASSVLNHIIDHCIKKGYYTPGIYRLAGFDASINLNTTVYMDKALPFTKTENMILRILIRSYPNPVNAKYILRHAFRTSRIPDISNIRTHISIMNKKFRNISNRNLIEPIFGQGYRILTPEFMKN